MATMFLMEFLKLLRENSVNFVFGKRWELLTVLPVYEPKMIYMTRSSRMSHMSSLVQNESYDCKEDTQRSQKLETSCQYDLLLQNSFT